MNLTIHVYLLDEGVDAWRPVSAEHVGKDIYRITGVHRMKLKSGNLYLVALFDVAKRISKAGRWDWLRMKELQFKNLIRVHPCPSVVDFP